MPRPLALAFLLLLAAPAFAESPPCGARDHMTKYLETKYGEAQRWVGLWQNDTVAFELWANARSGTWTLLRGTADGMACIVAAGNSMAFAPRGTGT